MFLSVFDLFKIGIGPSSSHTMGPMTAAARFLDEILSGDWPRPAGVKVDRIGASLHGSLAYTGIGHGSDRAVVLGLAGLTPQTVDPDQADGIATRIAADKRISPPGHPSYRFDPATDLVLDRKTQLTGHANGMAFYAYDAGDRLLLKRIYYSIGGGFVVSEEELQRMKTKGSVTTEGKKVPYPFRNAVEMLAMAGKSGLSIAEMKRVNEETQMSREELDAGLDGIWSAMLGCIERGLSQDGIMPGGLKVRRRARRLHDKLQEEWQQNRPNPLLANDWLSIYAMAVNEENAAGGPRRHRADQRCCRHTAGGAALLAAFPSRGRPAQHPRFPADRRRRRRHHQDQCLDLRRRGRLPGRGGIGLGDGRGGTVRGHGRHPEQVENAAEIALEHHLGMTCDPVGGLVQVPCIERNALGAVKAVTAASLAIKGDGIHFVPLDAAIETMRQTGLDMSEKYKETSLGGLAVNVVEC